MNDVEDLGVMEVIGTHFGRVVSMVIFFFLYFEELESGLGGVEEDSIFRSQMVEAGRQRWKLSWVGVSYILIIDFEGLNCFSGKRNLASEAAD